MISATPAATAFTTDKNRAALHNLPANQGEDFELAQRGFIATLDPPRIASLDGSRTVWDLTTFAFLDKEACPDTVHPALWRQARLNLNHGLFEVTPGIYQIRGFDLSNMTLVEGRTGVIVIDPLVCIETARAGFQLYQKHRGPRPVSAVIYTHSHTDHYGGVRGILGDDDMDTLPIIAPAEFLQEAISESLYAGHAMLRRAVYFSGAMLPRGPVGQVDAGLGKSVSNGQPSLIAPNDSILRTGDSRDIDGVEIIFQMAPETEAPAEMMMFFPQFHAFCAAEVATPTMHNLYTPRGAQVRNARNWWRALDEAIQLFGDKTQVLFAQHHWPRWGQAEIVDYLAHQRDLYKFMHDQALRLMNHGYTPTDIAEMVSLPRSLASKWYCREYYGTLSHNLKGVYQRYLGWYDSHPANLNPHPPVQAGLRYVDFMGGPDEVVRKARIAFEQGDYRWVVEVLKHVVFSTPDHAPARELQAQALEQLGFQSESAPWRNEYLVGAHELRNGPLTWAVKRAGNVDQLRAMTTEMLLDYVGIRLNAQRAEGKRLCFTLSVTDPQEHFLVRVQNSALTYTKNPAHCVPTSLTINRWDLNALLSGQSDPVSLSSARWEGSLDTMRELLTMLDTFEPAFPIVTPKRQPREASQ